MYIVASALGWTEIAKSAAVNTLSGPLEDMTYMEEFDLITGADLYQLVSFRFRCADAACDVINGNSNYKIYGSGRWTLESWDTKLRHHGPADKFFEKLKSCPRGSTIKNAYDLEDKELRSASSKDPVVDGSTVFKIWKCRQEIEDAVEAAVANITFYECI